MSNEISLIRSYVRQYLKQVQEQEQDEQDYVVILIISAIRKNSNAKGGFFMSVRRVLEDGTNNEIRIERIPTTLRNRILSILSCLCRHIEGCQLHSTRRLIYYFPINDSLIMSLVTSPLSSAVRTIKSLCS